MQMPREPGRLQEVTEPVNAEHGKVAAGAPGSLVGKDSVSSGRMMACTVRR
jgi:hypothetical protein